MKNKILFLDTETGGLNPARHDLLSVGLVVWEDENIAAEKEILLKGSPGRVTEEAMAVNRIDLERHNRLALSKPKAVEEIIRFVDEYFEEKPVIVAGHNVGFDMAFLRQLFEKQGVSFGKYFSHRHIDTSSILQYIGIQRNYSNKEIQSFSSSDKAFRNFGVHIEPEVRHTALADAAATAQLFTQLIHHNAEPAPAPTPENGRRAVKARSTATGGKNRR
jgi:DNA polymerase-3 subunit epsilon